MSQVQISPTRRSLATLAVEALDEPVLGAVVHPIFQTANFLQEDSDTYGSVRYGRLSNSPQHLALTKRLACLENADDALVFASGMAAISTTLLAVLNAGERVLVPRNLYGGTNTFFKLVRRFGIETCVFDATRPESWDDIDTHNVCAVYVESVSNPLLEVPDLPAVVRFAKKQGWTSLIDNTFLSPVGLRPIELGFDLVVHSATKYLNGHSDVIAGVVAGRQTLIDVVREFQHHLGGNLDAHACFLLARGVKTLSLRVERQAATALRLARALVEHRNVAEVRYPGLAHDPGRNLASTHFDHFGGMLSFRTNDVGRADRFLDRVTIARHAASLGGVESLVVRPSRSSHLGLSPEERASLGIDDRLVRVSVGIEDPDELIADVLQALD